MRVDRGEHDHRLSERDADSEAAQVAEILPIFMRCGDEYAFTTTWLGFSHMRSTFSLRRRNYYPWLFLVLVVTANAAVFWVLRDKASPEIFLSTTGAVAALVHFLYSQHNHNTERFMGLFREFNARYDLLNNRLNALLKKDGALTYEDEQLLYDYFNLCAEEYLYFKSGYVDSEVWLSWLKGMKSFVSNPEIRHIWQEEIDSGSYYGFTLALIDEVFNTPVTCSNRQQ